MNFAICFKFFTQNEKTDELSTSRIRFNLMQKGKDNKNRYPIDRLHSIRESLSCFVVLSPIKKYLNLSICMVKMPLLRFVSYCSMIYASICYLSFYPFRSLAISKNGESTLTTLEKMIISLSLISSLDESYINHRFECPYHSKSNYIYFGGYLVIKTLHYNDTKSDMHYHGCHGCDNDK